MTNQPSCDSSSVSVAYTSVKLKAHLFYFILTFPCSLSNTHPFTGVAHITAPMLKSSKAKPRAQTQTPLKGLSGPRAPLGPATAACRFDFSILPVLLQASVARMLIPRGSLINLCTSNSVLESALHRTTPTWNTALVIQSPFSLDPKLPHILVFTNMKTKPCNNSQVWGIFISTGRLCTSWKQKLP